METFIPLLAFLLLGIICGLVSAYFDNRRIKKLEETTEEILINHRKHIEAIGDAIMKHLNLKFVDEKNEKFGFFKKENPEIGFAVKRGRPKKK